MPLAARASSAGLGEVLARVGNDGHRADGLHVFSGCLPADIDPLSLWEVTPDGWAGCWETEGERWAGLGRTLAIPGNASGAASLDRVADAEHVGPPGIPAVRLFGGIPFRPGEDDPDWGALPTCGFVLPRWSVFRRDGLCHLQLAVDGRPDAASRAALLAELAEVEAALRPGEPSDEGGGGAALRPAAVATDSPEGRGKWETGIRAALEEIEGGMLEKVVLSRRLDLVLETPTDGRSVLRRLRDARAGRFRFGLRHGDTTFVGASPECLFEKRGRRVSVEALAGTFDLGATPDDDALVRAAEHLFASGKDLEEHALVVRGIVDVLLPLASSVEAGNWPDVRAAGSLAHLSTAIAADLRAGVSAFDLIDALHPTPAVGGLPRDAALRFIRRFESDPRGLYAAPVGWLEPGGDACLAVGIRSALLRPGQARVFAGAGIVAASDPAAEWEETGAKLRWLGEMLETGG